MYKAEFDKHLNSGKASNAIVLFGESHFLIDRYAAHLSNVPDSSKLAYYHDEYDFNSAKAHLSQASLFGDRNVLVLKSEKKINKKEIEAFIGFCEKNPDNVFIYAYYGDDHKTYQKGFAKTHAMSVRFFHPNHGESINIIDQEVRAQNIQMDKYSIAHLLNIHNGDVALAINEIEKFALYDKPITTKDIDTLVHGLATVNMDELINTTLSKKDFSNELENILEHGEDEIRVVTAFTAYLTQLYMFNIYIRVNGAPNALEILGYPAPKFVVDAKAKVSLRFKPEQYYLMHELLLDTELQMKSADANKYALLVSTLIRLQNLL